MLGTTVTEPPPPPPTATSAAAGVPHLDDLEALFRGRWAGMVRLAAALTGVPSVAEEVVQDAFAQVHRRWETLADPAAYLRTCVVNGSREVQRRAGVRERRDHLTLVRDADATEPTEPDEMADVLSTLPERQRTALVLRFYADWPEQDIADVLRCRPATVRSLIHRGLKSLKEVLEP